jgi:hypothetical protein
VLATILTDAVLFAVTTVAVAFVENGPIVRESAARVLAVIPKE